MESPVDDLVARFVRDASKAHYALLLTPVAERAPAAAVLAFDAQMRKLPAVSPDVAPTKLHWWHEEIERLRQGQPRHPVTKALRHAASDDLVNCLNERLHGAVVDLNGAQVGADDLERYLHFRSGAVFEALAVLAGHAPRAADAAAGVVCAVSDLLRESRDQAFADIPAASLRDLASAGASAMSDEDITLAVEAALRLSRARALATLHTQSPGSITGCILLALYKKDWPAIIATPAGKPARTAPPWSRLWTAWQTARRFRPPR